MKFEEMRPFHWVSIAFLATELLLVFIWINQLWSPLWHIVAFVIYMTIMTVGVMRMRLNFFYKHHHSGSRNTQNVALTFDDGPAGETLAILDILKAEGVKATFFTIGKRAADAPDVVVRWQNDGHLIGNHSMYHGHNFDWKSSTAMLEEMEEANTLIQGITGCRPMYFRPPYGITNPAVAKAIKRSGMHSIGWSLRSYDTNFKDAEALLKRTLKLLKGGDVVLLHDSKQLTREILTQLIRQARSRGFTFVRLDELLHLNPYA